MREEAIDENVLLKMGCDQKRYTVTELNLVNCEN